MATRNRRAQNRARAIWYLGREHVGEKQVRDTLLELLGDSDENIRATLIRMASQSGDAEFQKAFWETVDFSDTSAAVRRELLIAMRQPGGLPFSVDRWCELAGAYQSGDRWYLEALGIAAHSHWDACLGRLMNGTSWNLESAELRDMVWRSRAKNTPELLAKIIQLPSTSDKQTLRYFRSFDFCDKAQVDAVVRKMAFSPRKESRSKTRRVIVESTSRFAQPDLSSDEKLALTKVVRSLQGTSDYVKMVKQFSLASEYDRLLEVALKDVGTQKSVDAMSALFQLGQSQKLKGLLVKLASPSEVTAESSSRLAAMLNSLASTGRKPAAVMIGQLVQDSKLSLEARRQAIAAMGKLFPGSLQLIEWAEKNQYNTDLEPALVAALSNAPSSTILERARKRFPKLGGGAGRPIPV